MHLGYPQYTFGMVYESFSLDVIYCVFNYMPCITGGKMALDIDDQHSLYYHMDAYRPIIMGIAQISVLSKGGSWVHSFIQLTFK